MEEEKEEEEGNGATVALTLLLLPGTKWRPWLGVWEERKEGEEQESERSIEMPR